MLTGQETLKGGPPDEETDEGITLQLQGPKPKVVTKVVTRYVKKGLFGLPSPAAFADFQYLLDKGVLVPGLSPEERDAMRDLAADLRSELGCRLCPNPRRLSQFRGISHSAGAIQTTVGTAGREDSL